MIWPTSPNKFLRQVVYHYSWSYLSMLILYIICNEFLVILEPHKKYKRHQTGLPHLLLLPTEWLTILKIMLQLWGQNLKSHGLSLVWHVGVYICVCFWFYFYTYFFSLIRLPEISGRQKKEVYTCLVEDENRHNSWHIYTEINRAC